MTNNAENINNDFQYNLGIEQIDISIKTFFENTLKVRITERDNIINVPILYGSPEKWKNIRKDGFLRDMRNRIMAPMIVYKRTSITKNKSFMRNIDINKPNMFITKMSKYNKDNTYEPLNVLNNRNTKNEFVNLIVPDYIDITYEFVMWTNYISQMNELIEIISPSDGSYWGDMKTHRFLVLFDSFSNTTEVNDGDDRIIRCNFDITLKGFILPNTLLRNIKQTKSYSYATVNFTESVVTELPTNQQIINITDGDNIITNDTYKEYESNNVNDIIIPEEKNLNDNNYQSLKDDYFKRMGI